MEISNQMFHDWKHDPVTMALMEKMRWFKELKLKEALTPDIIRAADSQLIQREYLGCIDTLDIILNLDFDDLFIPEE